MRETVASATRGSTRPERALGRDSVVLLDGSCRLSRGTLGNKAFGINRMRSLGLPVPPAFCLTTEVCAEFWANRERCLDRISPEGREELRRVECEMYTAL